MLATFFILFSELMFSLYSEEDWGRVSCSELPYFHIRSQHQFTIQILCHELSAPLCPCCCSDVEGRINKASRTVHFS